jgi:hypothetical protein
VRRNDEENARANARGAMRVSSSGGRRVAWRLRLGKGTELLLCGSHLCAGVRTSCVPRESPTLHDPTHPDCCRRLRCHCKGPTPRRTCWTSCSGLCPASSPRSSTLPPRRRCVWRSCVHVRACVRACACVPCDGCNCLAGSAISLCFQCGRQGQPGRSPARSLPLSCARVSARNCTDVLGCCCGVLRATHAAACGLTRQAPARPKPHAVEQEL